MNENSIGVVIALVGALIRQLRSKGALSDQDTQAIYETALKMAAEMGADGELVTALLAMDVKLDRISLAPGQAGLDAPSAPLASPE